MLLLEEHAKADDGPVDQEAADYGHDHGFDLDEVGVGEHNRQCCAGVSNSEAQTSAAAAHFISKERQLTNSHHHEKAGEETPEVQDSSAGALDEVIGVRATSADPVGYGGEDIGGDNKERVVHLEEGARENDEKEADCEDEGEGDDGLEAGGRHLDGSAPGRLRGTRRGRVLIVYRIRCKIVGKHSQRDA